MVKKQTMADYLKHYGPNNPEPPHLRDSPKAMSDHNALQAAEEYIESKNE